MENEESAKYFWVLLIPILFRSFTPFVFKWASVDMEAFTVSNVVFNHLYWLGFLLLIARAFFWQKALSIFRLSFAFPMTALSFVGIMVLSYWGFGEDISWTNVAGTAFIVVGVILMNKTQ